VNRQLQLYRETLRADELGFLLKKEYKERKVYFKVFRILMVVSFVVPYIAAWYRVLDNMPFAFSYARFFVSAGILLFISAFSVYCTYVFFLKNIQRDIRYKTKTIETNHITRKLHMPQTNTFHFYLDSPTKLSIEVSQDYFYSLNEGDEVNIEYTTHSREYLGYF
jgi:hypothetical protein